MDCPRRRGPPRPPCTCRLRRRVVRPRDPDCRRIGRGAPKEHYPSRHQPANIFVTTRGRPKILDFGLAKLCRRDGRPAGEVSPAATAAPTWIGESELTSPGVVWAPAAYMSPEQARAKNSTPDRLVLFRGCVYEMARPPSVVVTPLLPFLRPPARSTDLTGSSEPELPELERIVQQGAAERPGGTYQLPPKCAPISDV